MCFAVKITYDTNYVAYGFARMCAVLFCLMATSSDVRLHSNPDELIWGLGFAFRAECDRPFKHLDPLEYRCYGTSCPVLFVDIFARWTNLFTAVCSKRTCGDCSFI